MAISVRCPECARRYQAPDRMAGRRVKCKHCGVIFPLNVDPTAPSPGPGALSDDADALADLAPARPAGIAAAGAGPARPAPRAGEPDFDSLFEGDFYEVIPARANKPYNFPLAGVLDQWLPTMLLLVGFVWVVREAVHSNDTGQPWVGYVRLLGLLLAYLASVFPFTLMGARMGARKVNLELPPLMPVRVLGTYAIPFALGAALWLIEGKVSGLVLGCVVGALVALPMLWLVLRLKPEEAPTVLAYGAGSYVLSIIVAAAGLIALNLMLVGILRSARTEHALDVSPLGPGFKWDGATLARRPTLPAPPIELPVVPPPVIVDAPATPRPTEIAGADTGADRPAKTDPASPGEEVAVLTPPGETPARAAPANRTPPKGKPPAAAADDGETRPTLFEEGLATNTNPGSAARQAMRRPPDVSSVGPDGDPDPSTAPSEPVQKDPAAETADAPAATAQGDKPAGVGEIVSRMTTAAEGQIADVLYPAVGGPWAAVVRQSPRVQDRIHRWSTAGDWERRGEAVFAPDRLGSPYHLSPNGDAIARISDFPALAVQIFSYEKDKLLPSLRLDRSLGTPRLLGFASPEQLIVHWDNGGRSGLEMWNLKTGKFRQVPVETFAPEPGNWAVSPDGKMFAAVTRGRGDAELELYNLASGKLARDITIKELDWGPAVKVTGMAFSPDGARVAALFEENGQGLFLCWSVPSGKVLFQHVYAGGLGGAGAEPAAPGGGQGGFRGSTLSWLDNGNAFLLYGAFVFETETGRLLGELEIPDVKGQSVAGRDVCHLVQQTGDGQTRVLVVKLKLGKAASAAAATRTDKGADNPPRKQSR